LRIRSKEHGVPQVRAHPRWSQGKLTSGMPHFKSVIECSKPVKNLKTKKLELYIYIYIISSFDTHHRDKKKKKVQDVFKK